MKSKFVINKATEVNYEWLFFRKEKYFGQRKCLSCCQADDYFNGEIHMHYSPFKNITEFHCYHCGNYGEEEGTIMEIYMKECGYLWNEYKKGTWSPGAGGI